MPDTQSVCNSCKGCGWLLASTGECYDEIQRCDDCETFPGDLEAWSYIRELMDNALRKTLMCQTSQHDQYQYKGLMGLIDLLKPFQLGDKAKNDG